MGNEFIEVKMLGLRRTRRSLDAGAKRIMPKLGRNVAKAGEYVIGESRKQFAGMRTKALYRISGGKKVRRTGRFTRYKTGGRSYAKYGVTSPPDKLGIFTGQYRKSITQDVRRAGSHKWTTEVGPTVKHARVHELGIRPMPKRQVLTPGVKAAEDDVFRILGRTFRVVT